MPQSELAMARELRESPDVVGRQPEVLAAPLRELVTRLQRSPPQFVMTCARGSSAHAATFGKHLIERHLGIPVGSAAPNIAAVYGQRLRMKGQLFLAISQSGQSHDLIEMARMAKSSGALAVAILNETESPLAAACDIVLPMAAGPETSVAATKSFVGALAVLLRLTAAWAGLEPLVAALDRLPARLAAASALDWSAPLRLLAESNSLVSIGRGPTLAIAREASLKLKETCNLHAEAFSGAEFLHGPVALVSPLYPILLFMPADEAEAGMRALAADLHRKAASLFTAETGESIAGRLPVLPSDHPDADAVCQIQSFYGLAVELAKWRGTNVDQPRHLQKVTRTR